ncbi:hypothetical protein [Spongiimicrobium sp. 3-5]|uniref:hypothetical protein n=1 Tax=Spongiimicrobium sp. 3-5 TaxID=3332596 RepID=UPI003980D9F5
MENWYIPITIIPGIGLLILSTSNLMVALSNEMRMLIADTTTTQILMEKKLRQLKLLNSAMVFLYSSVGFLLVSGLVSGIMQSVGGHNNSFIYITIGGICWALIGLALLVIYSFKAVKLRQDQFNNKC